KGEGETKGRSKQTRRGRLRPAVGGRLESSEKKNSAVAGIRTFVLSTLPSMRPLLSLMCQLRRRSLPMTPRLVIATCGRCGDASPPLPLLHPPRLPPVFSCATLASALCV
ncbi:unnamed protein product, partial [Scytosiphon promiscuus]